MLGVEEVASADECAFVTPVWEPIGYDWRPQMRWRLYHIGSRRNTAIRVLPGCWHPHYARDAEDSNLCAGRSGTGAGLRINRCQADTAGAA